MSTIALILAAGEQARWEMDKPPYYKQLLKVGDETIIERLERQCHARSGGPVVTVSHAPELQRVLGSGQLRGPYFIPEARRWTVETLLSTRQLWYGWDQVIILLGDAVYSKATMDRIFNAPDQELCVFGNLVEIYALVMRPTDQSLVDILRESVAYAEHMVTVNTKKGHGKLRKFYQQYCGLDLSNPADMESEVLQWVDGLDYTRDVDLPRDYDALLREVVETGRLDDLPQETT